MGVTYRLIRAWARCLVGTWYRGEVRGAPFPSEAPCILVANHTNGLCDGHYQLACTERPVRVLAKYKLFEIPVLGWVFRHIGAIPVYRKKDGVDTSRNVQSFRAIQAALASGDVIAIFPEGESRSTPYLRELRTGAARIALETEEAGDWRAGVRIVPVGITYEDVTRFRSRAEAWIGTPIEVAEWRGRYEAGAAEAVRGLTEQCAAALRAVTLEVPRGADDGRAAAALAAAVERLLPPDGRPLASRRQAAWEGFERLRERDPEGHERRVEAALQLDRNLRGHGLTSGDVLAAAPPRPARLLGELALGALVGVPFALATVVVWGPPALCARLIGARGASTPDKVVTVTLLVGFALVVLWGPLLAWLVTSRTGPTGDVVVLIALALGAVGLPRVADHWRALLHLLARVRLAGDEWARARLAEALNKVGALVARERER